MAGNRELIFRIRAHLGEAPGALDRLEREKHRVGAAANSFSGPVARAGGALRSFARGALEAGAAAERLERRFRFASDGAPGGARRLEFASAAQAFSGLAAARRGALEAGADPRRELERRDPAAGAAAALREIAEEGEAVGDRVGAAIDRAFDGAARAIEEFVRTGKLNFSDLANSIVADLLRIALRRTIAGALGSALGGLFPSPGGGAPVPAAAAGNVFHAALRAGAAPESRTPGVRPSIFADAPRVHGVVAAGGLRSDEAPPPPTEVRVEVTNRGTPQRVERADARLDGGRLVVSLVADDIVGGGPVAGAIERSFAVRPRTG